MTADGAEWVHFDNGAVAQVDHTGTPIYPDRSIPHDEGGDDVHEPGPDGNAGGSAGVAELTGCWETSTESDRD